MSKRRVALFGATGFLGSAVEAALRAQPDVVVIRMASPRYSTRGRSVPAMLAEAERSADVQILCQRMLDAGVDVVVNAAGHPDASSQDEDALFGANALLPLIILQSAQAAGVPRMVHVSSAVVQNDRPVLDESESMRPFSPYSASKVAGERNLRQAARSTSVIRYRPPSVHAPTRRVTQKVRKIAQSPLASVSAPGTQRSPQALLPNVAAAVAFLAVTDLTPPAVVMHPWEGMTTTSLMEALGGRKPIRVPGPVARAIVRGLKVLGARHGATAANARRIEILWLGQRQDDGWLTAVGWMPPEGRDSWRKLLEDEGEL